MSNTRLSKITYSFALAFISLFAMSFLNPAHAVGMAGFLPFLFLAFLIFIAIISIIVAGISTGIHGKKITGSKFTYFIKEFFITAGIIIAICISLPLAISLFASITNLFT